jgi:hypothetical protein
MEKQRTNHKKGFHGEMEERRMLGGELGDGEIIECTVYTLQSTALLGKVARIRHKKFCSSSFCSNLPAF